MARFDLQVFLISGGSHDLGKAQARQLIAKGAPVMVADVPVEQGQALAANLGPGCTFQPLEATSEAQWDTTVAAAERIGPLRGSTLKCIGWRDHGMAR